MSDSPFPPQRVLICSLNKNTYTHECEEYLMGKNPDTTSPDEYGELYGDTYRLFATNDKARPGLVFLTALETDGDGAVDVPDREELASYFTTGEIRTFIAELEKVCKRAEKEA